MLVQGSEGRIFAVFDAHELSELIQRVVLEGFVGEARPLGDVFVKAHRILRGQGHQDRKGDFAPDGGIFEDFHEALVETVGQNPSIAIGCVQIVAAQELDPLRLPSGFLIVIMVRIRAMMASSTIS